MNVLVILHHEMVGPARFARCIRGAGHRVNMHSFVSGPLSRGISDYGAVLVCGGPMNVEEDEHFPWLSNEIKFLREGLVKEMPILGICLGAQILAKAANAHVQEAPEAEIGWYEVETTNAGRSDSVSSVLPPRFHAFQWHKQMHTLPQGATILAQNHVGIQAYRIGNSAWGVQFHPEVTQSAVLQWLSFDGWPIPGNATSIAAETRQRMPKWSRIGNALCGAFLKVAASAKDADP